MNLIINDTDHQLIIKSGFNTLLVCRFIFIDNDDYLSKVCLRAEGKEFKDNDDRLRFAGRARNHKNCFGHRILSIVKVG